MDFEKVIQKVTGKENFKLSNEVPFSYIFIKGFNYSLGLINGSFRKVGMNKVGRKLFVGRNVKLFAKHNFFLGDNVRIENGVTIDALSKNGIVFGNRVKIGENSKVICSGTLSELGIGISIGNDTSFAENAYFGSAGGIGIGNDVIAGQNVRFHSENHQYEDLDTLIRCQGINRSGIKVGNNVWIGSGVVFLDGSEVSDGCVVAANSVVNKKFEENSIIGGIPARLLKRRH